MKRMVHCLKERKEKKRKEFRSFVSFPWENHNLYVCRAAQAQKAIFFIPPRHAVMKGAKERYFVERDC